MRYLLPLTLALLAACALHPNVVEDITERPGIHAATAPCHELAVDSTLGPAGARFSIVQVHVRRSSAGTFPVVHVRFEDGRAAVVGIDYFDLALGAFDTLATVALSPVARLIRPCR